SGAAPTACMSGWALTISASSPRTSAESSTISTLMRLIALPSGEKLDFTVDFGAGELRAVVTLALEDRVVRHVAQLLHPDPAAAGKVADLARVGVHEVARQHRYALGRQVAQHELRVALADVGDRQALQHVAPAEHLRLERAAAGAHLHELVDQHLHRVIAVTGRGA